MKPAIDKVKPNIDAIWDMYADKGATSPRLQYLYARLTALDRIIGQFRNLTNATLGALNPRLGEKVERMIALLRVRWRDELEREISLMAASRPGVIGVITKQAPRPANSWENDPNHPRYRGDAFTR